MLKTLFRAAVATSILLTLTACAPNISGDNYSSANAGQMYNVQNGIVIDKRVVNVDKSNSGLGALSGAALGGIGGSAIGGSTRANLAGAVGGALVGGLLGNLAENKITSQQGFEYIVKLTNRSSQTTNTIAVVQGPTPQISVGQRVLVIYKNGKAQIAPEGSYVPAANS